MRGGNQNRLLRLLTTAALCAVFGVVGPEARAAELPEMMDHETVQAVEKGLAYLARTQRPDGSWLSSGGRGSYPGAMTALGGLAMLAGGSTPESGPYARHVTRALNYTLRLSESRDDGLITGPREGRPMYSHGFSMLFLAQCYGMEISPEYEQRIRTALEKAVELTARSQSDLGAAHSHAGGWMYYPQSSFDEGSVTVTQLQALRACRNVGIKVPTSTIDRSVAYLKYCQNPDGGISYSAQHRTDSRPAISAAAIACFYAAGVYDRATGGAGSEAEMVEKLVEYVKDKVSQDSGWFFYSNLYMAQGMYQRGGEDWREYFPQIRNELLDRQAPDGSWNGDGIGTTYGTALSCMILQLPYGYLPVVQR
ncbi:MAG: prenyltransferase/squalene oxidase repeat-containing protein [Phycisphaerae bacterium]